MSYAQQLHYNLTKILHVIDFCLFSKVKNQIKIYWFFLSIQYMNIKQGIEKIDNIRKEPTETITTSNLSNAQSSSEVYLNFSFFKVDPKWRWLNEIGKDEAAKEFASLLDVARTKMTVKAYSTLRLQNGVVFMIWMDSN